MAVEQGPMSGFRDLLAEQMIPRQEMLDTVRNVYETYGFVPLKTPALERHETMTGKYGEEGEKLMYAFTDNGGRKVAMRYDQTVPLARVVAQHSGRLPKPYKRYALGEVWRGESPQAGRYREFTQFDADTVGSYSLLADTEIIAMMNDSMRALNLDTLVRVNDRRILDGLAQACGVTEEREFRSLIGTIDKYEKIGEVAVLDEVGTKFGDSAKEIVGKYLSVAGSAEERLRAISELLKAETAQASIEDLLKIMGSLSLAGYSEEQIIFDQTIARGLDYYTSTVYETTLTEAPEIGSICSGGRFDNLIEAMGGPSTPAVGTSIGVDRLLEGMRITGKLSEAKTKTQVFIANVGEELSAERFVMAQKLRKAGIPTELYFEDTKLGKQLKNIDKLGVRKVIIFGENEHAEGQVAIKDLETGEQVSIPLSELEAALHTDADNLTD